MSQLEIIEYIDTIKNTPELNFIYEKYLQGYNVLVWDGGKVNIKRFYVMHIIWVLNDSDVEMPNHIFNEKEYNILKKFVHQYFYNYAQKTENICYGIITNMEEFRNTQDSQKIKVFYTIFKHLEFCSYVFSLDVFLFNLNIGEKIYVKDYKSKPDFINTKPIYILERNTHRGLILTFENNFDMKITDIIESNSNNLIKLYYGGYHKGHYVEVIATKKNNIGDVIQFYLHINNYYKQK